MTSRNHDVRKRAGSDGKTRDPATAPVTAEQENRTSGVPYSGFSPDSGDRSSEEAGGAGNASNPDFEAAASEEAGLPGASPGPASGCGAGPAGIPGNSRRYPARPMVGVGAIIFRGGSVLLVRRGREPAYGQWTAPGGLVKVGESLQDAVRREVLEESGLDVKVLDLAAVLDRVIYDAQGRIEYHYVILDFICEAAHGDPMAAGDVMDCAFVPLDSLGSMDMTHGTEEVIRRAFDRIHGGSSPPVYDARL